MMRHTISSHFSRNLARLQRWSARFGGRNAWIVILATLLLLSNFSLVAQFLGRLNPLAKYEQQVTDAHEKRTVAEARLTALEYDRLRLEDASNIILALQEFYFQKNAFPSDLATLKQEGYLDKDNRLLDPQSTKPYFYQRRDQDFVLCIVLSDMVKGVNTNDCPAIGE